MKVNNKWLVIDVTDRLDCLDLGLGGQAFVVVDKSVVSEPMELDNGMVGVRMSAGLYCVVVTKGESSRLVGTTRTERSEGV